MTSQVDRRFMKIALGSAAVMFGTLGGAIFYTKLTSYVTPLLTILSGIVLAMYLFIKKSKDTFREVGLPEAVVYGLSGIAILSGILSFTQVGNPVLSTIGSVVIVVTGLTLLMEALTL